MDVSLKFLGAAGTVTGSKTLLSVNGRKYLIDCGLFQGLKELRELNWRPFPAEESEIHSVVLTHAHLDHSGYLPVLIKRGFTGKIYSTPATKDLCKLLLPDAAYLEEEDAAFANKHGFSKHRPAFPLFNSRDADRVFEHFSTAEWGEKIHLNDTTTAQFSKAGHLLGAAIAQINASGKIITFSGDLGRFRDMPLLEPPQKITGTDFLILEATYGDRKHPNENPAESLRKIIIETHERRGSLLIPAFAVGRAQQLLCLVRQLKNKKEIPDIPVYLNSPMAAEATKVLFQYEHELGLKNADCREIVEGVHIIASATESKNLNRPQGPSIIISASGMATGGRVLHHLKFMAPNPDNTILFAGFQAPGTRGEAMIHGAKSVKIHGEEIPVRAKVVHLQTLSGHADQDELILWLKNFHRPPKQIFLNHGQPAARKVLKQKIEEELHWSVILPDELEEFSI